VEDLGQGLQLLAGQSAFDQPFTSKEHGSGIGLALSHRIITRQHGQLFAWSRDPRGAAFSFTLPLTREASAVVISQLTQLGDSQVAFRAAMAKLPAAVNVVTTNGPQGRAGITTVSAVCSVTDTPPTV
jgi:hypothetical protein